MISAPAFLRAVPAMLLFLAMSVPVQAQGVTVRAIQVTGGGDPIMAALAREVRAVLPDQLGARYQPGARGGARLVVHLTDYDLPTADDGDDDPVRPFGRGGPTIDLLEGDNVLLDARGRTLGRFPMRATTTATGASAMMMSPPPYRLRALANSYARWVAQKLH